MPPRLEIFPHVIEMNYQARRRLGCCVYLVFDGAEWVLIDIGYEDTLDDIVNLIRQMDFPLNGCKYLVATHADVDHVQALKRAKEIMPQAQVVGPSPRRQAAGHRRADHDLCGDLRAGHLHPHAARGDSTRRSTRGTDCRSASCQLDVWHTPGHAPAQLSFRLGEPAVLGRQHLPRWVRGEHRRPPRLGPAVVSSSRCRRIRDSNVEWLLPSHGPIFRKDNAQLRRHDRPPRRLPAHGRLRHLRRRLAAAGRVGR